MIPTPHTVGGQSENLTASLQAEMLVAAEELEYIAKLRGEIKDLERQSREVAS